ncbi:MAG TPA: ABC transporter permease [Chloroflexota bacterium]|nr:ABC transporter permease [Chloroflexota bacterium]
MQSPPARVEAARSHPVMAPVTIFLYEIVTIARYSLLQQQRYKSWIFNTSLTPFFLMAPLIFIAHSFLGPAGQARQAFFEFTGYENYIGYLVIPLVDATMTSTVYSNIGHTIRQEQMTGTLERTLMTLRFPMSLILGRSLGFLIFVWWFAASALFLAWFFFGLQLSINPGSAAVLLPLHLLLVYGVAFLMSSLFLWISDAYAIQMLFSRFVLLTLAGATYPVAMLPDWLRPIARLIPFTWLYELEREAFLRAAPLTAIQDGLIVLAAMVAALWILAIWFFNAMLDRARRTGRLGMY